MSYRLFIRIILLEKNVVDRNGLVGTSLRSRNRIPVAAGFFAPVHIGPGAHPASCTMGTSCLPGGKAVGAWC